MGIVRRKSDHSRMLKLSIIVMLRPSRPEWSVIIGRKECQNKLENAGIAVAYEVRGNCAALTLPSEGAQTQLYYSPSFSKQSNQNDSF